MNFYAYGAPGVYSDESNTDEFFKAYKDAGFNVALISGVSGFCKNGDEKWETSVCKQTFDRARSLGFDKIVMRDFRICIDLIELKDKLIGENGRFKSEDELTSYVKDCMKDYIHEKGLFGFIFLDEPFYEHIVALGYVYRAVKRAAKEFGKDDFYIQINLNPMIINAYSYLNPEYKKMNESEIYAGYIDSVLTRTGADWFCVDNYPFRPSYNGGRFLDGYFSCLQILAKQAAKHNAKLEFVLQSFEMYHKTLPRARAGFRRVNSVNEMMLQVNAALSFGVKQLSFYTFFTMAHSATDSAYRTDEGSSPMTSDGEKTALYGFVKAALAHASAVAEFIEDYEYAGAKIFVHESQKEHAAAYLLSEGICLDEGKGDVIKPPSAPFINDYTFDDILSVDCDKDVLLLSELGKSGAPNLYAATNVIDSPYKTDPANMVFSAKLKAGFKSVNAFVRGKWQSCPIDNERISFTLAQGEAVYFIPVR